MRLFLKAHLQGARQSQSHGQKLSLVMWKPNRVEDVDFVTELLQAGKVVPVIDSSYGLSETPEAFRRLEAGGICGKAVITVWTSSQDQPWFQADSMGAGA